jgi:hypothetical protein
MREQLKEQEREEHRILEMQHQQELNELELEHQAQMKQLETEQQQELKEFKDRHDKMIVEQKKRHVARGVACANGLARSPAPGHARQHIASLSHVRHFPSPR